METLQMGILGRIFGGRSPAEQSKQHFLRGVQLLQSERVNEAIAAFDKAIELQPDNVNAWHWKGVTLDVMGKPAEALTCLQWAVKILPNDPMPHFDKGKVEAQLGRHAEAALSFRSVLRLATPGEHGAIIAEVRKRLAALPG
jgi:tetratricopeptide (TPR) repeat protein